MTAYYSSAAGRRPAMTAHQGFVALLVAVIVALYLPVLAFLVALA